MRKQKQKSKNAREEREEINKTKIRVMRDRKHSKTHKQTQILTDGPKEEICRDKEWEETPI